MPKTSSNPSKNYYSLSYLIWEINNKINQKIAKKLLKWKVTPLQFRVLSVVAKLNSEQEIVTQINITNYLRTDQTMISKVVRDLELKQYLVREVGRTDTRAKVITITELGLSLVKSQQKIIQEMDNQIDMDGIESDSKLGKMLNKIINKLNK
jgi:MarR family transcriptional regulator, organic hydroperoxide resistance regulator